MKTWRWIDRMYGIRIVLMYGDGVEPFMRRLNKQAGWEMSDADIKKSASAQAFAPYWRDAETGRATLYLWFSRRVNARTVDGLSTIGHEAVHGAIHVCEDLQIPIDAENQEPCAYYQTYLFTEVLNRLRRVK